MGEFRFIYPADETKARKARNRLLDSVLSIKSGALSSGDRALEFALREMFQDSWNVRDSGVKTEVLRAIRRTVLLCKLGAIAPDGVVEFAKEAIKEVGILGLSIDATVLLLQQQSILKKDVCRIFGINPKQPRTLERWQKGNGYRGTLLKRSGKNGRFLPSDIIQFMRTGKRNDVFLAYQSRKVK